MSIQARAKLIWPGLSSADLNIALWSLTTFPMGEPDEVLRALKDAYQKSGGDLLQALQIADQANQTVTRKLSY